MKPSVGQVIIDCRGDAYVIYAVKPDTDIKLTKYCCLHLDLDTMMEKTEKERLTDLYETNFVYARCFVIGGVFVSGEKMNSGDPFEWMVRFDNLQDARELTAF